MKPVIAFMLKISIIYALKICYINISIYNKYRSYTVL